MIEEAGRGGFAMNAVCPSHIPSSIMDSGKLNAKWTFKAESFSSTTQMVPFKIASSSVGRRSDDDSCFIHSNLLA